MRLRPPAVHSPCADVPPPGRADLRLASVRRVTARITAAMVARSHGVSDPRWAPGGARLGWVDSFDGRSDLVVAATEGSTPPAVVTADSAVGDGWCWAGPNEVVVSAGGGRPPPVHGRGRGPPPPARPRGGG